MMKGIAFSLTILALCCFKCDASDTCPETTRSHSTECNKYFKCIKLPNNHLKWITLTCQEGLIYDGNLRSCAIPSENWDCIMNSEESYESYKKDDNNIYGIENLKMPQEVENEDYRSVESDDFLEVIDGDEMLSSSGESRSENDENSPYDENSNFSGDGSVMEIVTQSTPTIQMLTTQVQRLTQLIKFNSKFKTDELTADDLNSYLDVHKIQTKSPEYQSNNFSSSEKTAVPPNGKIDPEIMREILSRQTQLNAIGLRETTLAMDQTTQKPPVYYKSKESITEIKLNSGHSLNGTVAHQIVVNRPEGAVLFNVPPSEKNQIKEHTPYLSEDILKTILEISKQMVTQNSNNNQKNSNDNNHGNFQSSQPIYYAIPFPIFSPSQSSAPNYHNNFMNSSMNVLPTTTVSITSTVMPPVVKKRRKPSKRGSTKNKIKSKNDYVNQNFNAPDDSYDLIEQQQQMPTDYYSYYNNYQQNYPAYGPVSYYQQYSTNDRYANQNSQNRFGNLYGNFYENRPLVSDSSASAPISYVKRVYSAPYRKESFSQSYESVNEDSDDEYDALHEESDDSENGAGLSGSSNDGFYEDEYLSPPKDKNDGLICSYGITRQANKTDCMKYYVCNSKTKEVLTYTCPSLTAFNDQTKYCDASSYNVCKKMKDREKSKISNRKYFQEAHKALQQAKLESQKVERLANLVREESQKIFMKKLPLVNGIKNGYEDEEQEQSHVAFIPQPIRQRPSIKILPRPSKRPVITRKVATVASKISSFPKSNTKRKKKKKVKCNTIGNIADPEDNTSYWHCFKSIPDDRMKRIHKKCSPNLVFCPNSRYCSPSC